MGSVVTFKCSPGEMIEMYTLYRTVKHGVEIKKEDIKRILRTPGNDMGELRILCLSDSPQSLAEFKSLTARELFINNIDEALTIIIENMRNSMSSYCDDAKIRNLYKRCGNLIMALGDYYVDLSHSRFKRILVIDRITSRELRGIILNELRKRSARIQQSVVNDDADLYLAGSLEPYAANFGLREFLRRYQDLAGDTTLARLLRGSTWRDWRDLLCPEIIEKLARFASSHLSDYLYAIIYQLLNGSIQVVDILVGFATPLSSHISVDILGLCLGSRRYALIRRCRDQWEHGYQSLEKLCSGLELREEHITRIPTCRVCNGALTGTIYSDDRDKFGVYLCSQCSQSIIQKHITRVVCPICLSDEENMTVLGCGHSFCEECLAKVTVPVDMASCPLCRAIISSHGDIVQASAVVSRFLEEMKL